MWIKVPLWKTLQCVRIKGPVQGGLPACGQHWTSFCRSRGWTDKCQAISPLIANWNIILLLPQKWGLLNRLLLDNEPLSPRSGAYAGPQRPGSVVSISGEAGKDFSLLGNNLHAFLRKVLVSECTILEGTLRISSSVTHPTGNIFRHPLPAKEKQRWMRLGNLGRHTRPLVYCSFLNCFLSSDWNPRPHPNFASRSLTIWGVNDHRAHSEWNSNS